jgi:hypothetical protein
LIVSRKDQSNKVKLSPLTNHRNTKKGAIKGGFDRVTLFENVEKGFDKLFGYNRQLSETFEYCNTMKNSSMTEKLKMQEKEIADTTAQQQVCTSANQQTNKSASPPISELVSQLTNESASQLIGESANQSFDNAGFWFSAFPSGTDNSLISDEIEEQKLRKITKKNKGRKMS